MKIVMKPRGHGKTVDAVLEAVNKDCPIIVLNNHHKKVIKETAKKLNIDSKELIIVTVDELNKLKGLSYKKVVVDNADDILESLLGNEIKMITLNKEGSGPNPPLGK